MSANNNIPINQASTPHLYQLVGYFGIVIGLLYDFITLVLFIVIIWNGIRYLFSGVNPELKQKAQQGLMYAVLGLVVIVMAYIVIVFIGSFVANNSFSTNFINGTTLRFNLSNI
jgi:flagellar biosynthesis protein FlhB